MSQQILDSLKYFQPETILTVTFCVAILADLIFPKAQKQIGYISFLGILVAILFALRCDFGNGISIFSNMYAVDAFSVFFKVIIGISSLIVIAFSLQSDELNTKGRKLGEYYALLVALTLGMFLMTGASNLLMMYLALELSSITSYILSGYMREKEDSSEASLKYILFGAAASGAMLYGISILFGLTGSLDIYAIQKAMTSGGMNSITLLFATIFILVGFGYKISAAPFHFWTPDVYQGSPITITALLAVASKAGGFAMMIRFFAIGFSQPTVNGFVNIIQGFDWQMIIAAISVLTMTLGNLVAVWQTNMKRLLAYSSIAHAGYMLMAFTVMSNSGIAAIMLYFIIYLFMNLGAFYVVMILAQKLGSEDVEDYKGLAYRSPLVCVVMALFLVSLTGLPPTAGFIGKLYIFSSLIAEKWYWLALIGALNSVVSLFYYVKVFKNMFLKQPEGDTLSITFSPYQIAWMMILAIPTLFFGLYFSPLVEYAQASVKMFQ
ncbi:MAG: NADH-quinone oxidoreductase subunit N [Ignavibacteriales bacterium]|nr:NADH-quinone oxidoreductase subunit N [Ignavibacteriales bacterium]